MIALPESPTGADLVAAIETVAELLGMTAIEVAAPLSDWPANWLKQTREARQPRPATIDRVRALLAGQARIMSATVFIDAEQTLRERRLHNINDPAAIGARIDMRNTLAEDLAARIDRDQAARRATRERWLDIEQQRYGLTRRGRLPDDMPA